MISIIIRTIIFCSIIAAGSIYSTVAGYALIGFIVSISAWLSIRNYEQIIWWIIAAALIVSALFYRDHGVYFVMIIVALYVFTIIHEYLSRNHGRSMIKLMFTAISVGIVCNLIINLLFEQSIGYSIGSLFYIIIYAAINFCIIYYIACKLEKWIDRVTFSDGRCHT